MKECGASCDGWTVKSGQEQHTFPTGYMTWVIGVKEQIGCYRIDMYDNTKS